MSVRIPGAACPPGSFRYTVAAGDTMAAIARRFGVSLPSLISMNPHIPSPAELFPGDVLCVPASRRRWCCVVLEAVPGSPSGPAGETGVVLLSGAAAGFDTVAILVESLPPPSRFGNYNAYQGVVDVPGSGQFFVPLYQPAPPPPPGAVNLPNIWSGRTEIPPVLTGGTVVRVRPIGIFSGFEGPVLLQASLAPCLA